MGRVDEYNEDGYGNGRVRDYEDYGGYDPEVEMQERHFEQDGLDYDDFRDDEYDRGLGNTYNDHYEDEYERYRGKEDRYDDYNYGRDGSDSKEASDEPLRKHDDEDGDADDEEQESGESHEEMKLSLMQACGLNTMNMFGTGPFITIPFVVAATVPPGPHALIGYAVAAFACMNDSLVWSELGSIWPDSGGSYVYLRELYGRHTYGRLMAFLFVWQIMVSGPMECASGFIATAQYIAYITEDNSYVHHSGIAFAMCVCTVWALYREIDEVGTITLVLWAFTICAILFAIIAGYAAFDPKYIKTPEDAFDDPSAFLVSLGTAARYAVYDFTGYYDVNFVGTEVINPRETIPIACIVTCCVVAMVFFLVDVAVIGSMEWNPNTDPAGYVKLVTTESAGSNYIMALFCETHISRGFAIFFTLIVCVTIFGSCFSFMIGLAQIPYTAAKDGYFYHFLSHDHPTHKGLSDYSLLFVGLISTIFCFLELSIVIEGMLTMQLLVQFMGQGFGLLYYRYLIPLREQEARVFEMPCFPLPNIIQLVVFGFIFATTDTWIWHGTPLLEVAMVFIGSGAVCYFLWAKKNGFWPYTFGEIDSEEEGLDHMVVYVADDGFDDEFSVLKKRLAQKEAEIQRLKNLRIDSNDLIKDRELDLQNTVKALSHKRHRIIELSAKFEEQEDRCQQLLHDLGEKDKEVTEAQMERAELARKLNNLQVRFGIIESPSSDYLPSNSLERGDGSVLTWNVDEVIDWWKNNLPKGAQQFIPVVEECHLTGKDLIELDKEMLEQLGIKKLLVMKILKQIEPLRAEANYPPRNHSEMEHYSTDRGSKSVERTKKEKEAGRTTRSRSANRKMTTDSQRSRSGLFF